jgi:hypothetical protein
MPAKQLRQKQTKQHPRQVHVNIRIKEPKEVVGEPLKTTKTLPFMAQK